jgi:hypothetical protein
MGKNSFEKGNRTFAESPGFNPLLLTEKQSPPENRHDRPCCIGCSHSGMERETAGPSIVT